jgi:hypothetical protein
MVSVRILALVGVLAGASPALTQESLRDVQLELQEARSQKEWQARTATSLMEKCFRVHDDSFGNKKKFEALQTALEVAGVAPTLLSDEKLAALFDRATSLLVENHASNDRMGLLIARFLTPPDSIGEVARKKILATLDAIEARTESDAVRAACRFARLGPVLEKSETTVLEPTELETAVATLETIKADFGAAEHWSGSTVGEAIDQILFQLAHLSIGREAPEIEGQDLDGVPFKLSDYRGKVVLLDFWGNW